MNETMIHLDFAVRNCAAEVWLNDIPMRRYDGSETRCISIPVHQFLTDKVNTLELVINPGDSPGMSRTGPCSTPTPAEFAVVQVVEYEVGMFTGDPDAKKLVEVRWPGNEVNAEIYPRVLKTDFRYDSPCGKWKWQDGENIDLKTDREAIIRVIEVVFNCFQTGRPDRVVELSATRLQEGSRAYPARGYANIEAGMRQYFVEMAAIPEWNLVPLDPENFDFRLCAGGKMVEIVDKNWEPIICSVPVQDDQIYPFGMYLCKLDGRFVITR